MIGFWESPPGVALIAAGASVATSMVAPSIKQRFDKGYLRYRLGYEYQFEQQKALKDLIGRYHGQLVLSAYLLARRLRELEPDVEDWTWESDDDGQRYSFRTTLYRFVKVCAVASAFERQALVIDARTADPLDGQFLRYCRAILRCATDGMLYDGRDVALLEQQDLVFSGTLENIAASMELPDGFRDHADFARSFHPATCDDHRALCEFLERIPTATNRLAWDRMVATNLVLLAFLAAFGYEVYLPQEGAAAAVRDRFVDPAVAGNLVVLLRDTGFSDEEAGRIARGDIRRRGVTGRAGARRGRPRRRSAGGRHG